MLADNGTTFVSLSLTPKSTFDLLYMILRLGNAALK
jgi:hypothetical protein